MADQPVEAHKQWLEEIHNAKEARKAWGEAFRVDLARQYFLGHQNPGFPEEEWITVNKLYSHVMAQLPQLYSVNPYFYVKPKKSFQIGEVGTAPEQQEAAAQRMAAFENRGKTRAAFLNYLKSELDLRKKARMAILQAHFSFGVAKTRHAADMQKNPKAGQPIMDGEKEMVDEDGEVMRHPDEIPVNKRYVLDWVNSDDILFDEDAGPLEDSWAWVAQRLRVPKKKALKNPRYKTSVIKEMVGTAEQRKAASGFTDGAKRMLQSAISRKKSADKRNNILTFWEIYDLDKRQWLTIGEDAKDFVVAPDKLPPGVEKHPFSFLRFTNLDDSPYPYPPLSVGIDPQKEFCMVRSRRVTHRKRFNRKYTVIRQMLEDEADVSKLESGEDGTLIFTKNHGAVEPIADASLDGQDFSEINMLANDLTELLGAPGGSRGIANADSATEASILDARQDVKEGDRLSSVTDFVVDIAKKLDMLVQTHITEDEAVKIVGPSGEERWELVRADDYREREGEFQYSVNAGASRARLPSIERAQWIAFFSQVIIPFPHVLTMPHTMRRIAEMYEIEDEAMIEEMRQMGLKIMQGQVPPPGATGGSQPAENNPAAAVIGQALGELGGNANGGGAGSEIPN